MKSSFVVVAAAVALAGIVSLSFASVQDGVPRLPKPGKQHEILAREVGTWDAVLMMDGQPAGKATFTSKMDHGGLWRVGDFRGDMMGMSFTGHEVAGYDAKKQKYVSTWVDSMTDGLMTLEGDYDEKTNTISYFVYVVDPKSGQKIRERHDHKLVDADTFELVMNRPQADGKYAPMMSVKYTRKK